MSIGREYLYNHVLSNISAIVSAYLSLYCNIKNHLVPWSIIVKDFSTRELSWPSILILYNPIRSTNSLSHIMGSSSLAGNLTYLRFFSCFFEKFYKT